MMFTLEQIRDAHSKVKSGADFPAYIRDIKTLSVRYYETYVFDGHTDYYGDNNFKISSAPRYEAKTIAPIAKADHFVRDLKAHQAGKSDFPKFCDQSASSGVEKWTVDLSKMTCTYYDKAGTEILLEKIPE